MLPNYLINKYRSLRKQNYLRRLTAYKHSYAFIGAGSHSIGNLYPCIRQLNVPLKYICTRTIQTATQMAASFKDCTGTTDLDTILNDNTIKGVFISTLPQLQPDLIKKTLKAGKAVFVEKPPAFSQNELQTLITAEAENNTFCMPGLQRRFSTIQQKLKKHDLKTATYHYRYLTGPYPEGNPAYELFIHPIDFALQIFGPAEITTITKTHPQTIYIHLTHTNKTAGTLQLSTNHLWSEIIETLDINTAKEILEINYPFKFTGTEKPRIIAGIPMEKALPGPLIKKVYLDNQGAIPIVENNSLVTQGFYGEIEEFVKQVETGKTQTNTSLSSLVDTYTILDALNAAH